MQARRAPALIGSIPLATSEEVFRTPGDGARPALSRMPDGETGERSRWVYFQGQMLRAHPDMEIDPTVPPYKFVQWDGKVVREIEQARFKPGVDPDKVAFETGYDRAALASWDNVQAVARRRRDRQGHSLPGLPADAARQRLPLCQRPGAPDLFRASTSGR